MSFEGATCGRETRLAGRGLDVETAGRLIFATGSCGRATSGDVLDVVGVSASSVATAGGEIVSAGGVSAEPRLAE